MRNASPPRLNLEQCENFIIRWDVFRGHTIGKIASTDPGLKYLVDLEDNEHAPENLRMVLHQFLKFPVVVARLKVIFAIRKDVNARPNNENSVSPVEPNDDD